MKSMKTTPYSPMSSVCSYRPDQPEQWRDENTGEQVASTEPNPSRDESGTGDRRHQKMRIAIEVLASLLAPAANIIAALRSLEAQSERPNRIVALCGERWRRF